jgi:hypothetical protein
LNSVYILDPFWVLDPTTDPNFCNSFGYAKVATTFFLSEEPPL